VIIDVRDAEELFGYAWTASWPQSAHEQLRESLGLFVLFWFAGDEGSPTERHYDVSREHD
jgi:hypothetical protein